MKVPEYPGPVFHKVGSMCGQVVITGIQWIRDGDYFNVCIETEEGWRRIGRQSMDENFCVTVTPLGMFDETTVLEMSKEEYT